MRCVMVNIRDSNIYTTEYYSKIAHASSFLGAYVAEAEERSLMKTGQYIGESSLR